jgi:hypothetical protein
MDMAWPWLNPGAGNRYELNIVKAAFAVLVTVFEQGQALMD